MMMSPFFTQLPLVSAVEPYGGPGAEEGRGGQTLSLTGAPQFGNIVDVNISGEVSSVVLNGSHKLHQQNSFTCSERGGSIIINDQHPSTLHSVHPCNPYAGNIALAPVLPTLDQQHPVTLVYATAGNDMRPLGVGNLPGTSGASDFAPSLPISSTSQLLLNDPHEQPPPTMSVLNGVSHGCEHTLAPPFPLSQSMCAVATRHELGALPSHFALQSTMHGDTQSVATPSHANPCYTATLERPDVGEGSACDLQLVNSSDINSKRFGRGEQKWKRKKRVSGKLVTGGKNRKKRDYAPAEGSQLPNNGNERKVRSEKANLVTTPKGASGGALHRGRRTEKEAHEIECKRLQLMTSMESAICTHCGLPIVDKNLLLMDGGFYHAVCLKCSGCAKELEGFPSCFVKEATSEPGVRTYCRSCYSSKFYPTKCTSCGRQIQPTDWVRRAKSSLYHLACFACEHCKRQLSTGEEFFLQDERLLCKQHYMELVRGEDCGAKQKAKRVRTTFAEEQIGVLQAHFQIDSNPDGADLERIANLTGLSKNSRARQKKYQGHPSSARVRNRVATSIDTSSDEKGLAESPESVSTTTGLQGVVECIPESGEEDRPYSHE